MAIDYQVITKSNRPQLGSQAVGLANQLRDLRDKADALNDAASHMHDGANFAMVEAQFGLAPGAGGNFVTMLQQMQDILNSNATIAGATRLANLDEFVARLAGQ